MRESKRKHKVAMIVICGDNMNLQERTCIPCEGGIPPLNRVEINNHLSEISNDWQVINNNYIQRKWLFSNFQKSLDFVNLTGEICEQENHHANYELGWGFVKIMIWTHKINGLTISDFILAAKFDEVECNDS